MEVEAVGSAVPVPRPPQPMGVTAELAEARKQLRQSAPPDRWASVMDEVSRLQIEERMAPLAALRAVYAKLAAGWQPPVPR
jgi:hypothetical protein